MEVRAGKEAVWRSWASYLQAHLAVGGWMHTWKTGPWVGVTGVKGGSISDQSCVCRWQVAGGR